MNPKRCPFCNSPIEFEDFDSEFTSFEDCGDHIVATGHFDCQCGESLTIEAIFAYNENYTIR